MGNAPLRHFIKVLIHKLISASARKTSIRCFGPDSCYEEKWGRISLMELPVLFLNVLERMHVISLSVPYVDKHGALASHAGETCFVWSKNRDKDCSCCGNSGWRKKGYKAVPVIMSLLQGVGAARRRSSCPHCLPPTQIITNHIFSSKIFAFMLENMAIFPYKNGNF